VNCFPDPSFYKFQKKRVIERILFRNGSISLRDGSLKSRTIFK
jgi:hypothetical protein